MRIRIITTMAVCATGLVLSAFGQNSSTTPGGTTTDQSTSPSTSPAGSSTLDNTRRPTGRMGQQELRASKLMNSEVKSSQGQSLGTIQDIVLNPSSGRIDFAVISLNSSASSSSSTSSTTTPSTASSTSSTDSSSGGKLAAVPWMLLRPSSSGSSSIGSTSSSSVGSSSSSSQQAFVFAGDSTKLMSAPTFDQSNWPDITQYSWRQSIYSHFGMSPGSATGGATSPGGYDSSSGSSSIPRNSSSIPGSSSPTPSPSPSSPDNTGK